jgi:hypothetical protein
VWLQKGQEEIKRNKTKRRWLGSAAGKNDERKQTKKQFKVGLGDKTEQE